jgi:hypothetical protein
MKTIVIEPKSVIEWINRQRFGNTDAAGRLYNAIMNEEVSTILEPGIWEVGEDFVQEFTQIDTIMETLDMMDENETIPVRTIKAWFSEPSKSEK